MATALKPLAQRAPRKIKGVPTPPTMTIVHVAVQTEPTWKDGAMIHAGLIFYPAMVFSDVNIRAREFYREFFRTGNVCAVMPVEINESLGSWVEQLVHKIGARTNGLWISGMIAHFNVGRGQQAEQFWQNLHDLSSQKPSDQKRQSA